MRYHGVSATSFLIAARTPWCFSMSNHLLSTPPLMLQVCNICFLFCFESQDDNSSRPKANFQYLHVDVEKMFLVSQGTCFPVMLLQP